MTGSAGRLRLRGAAALLALVLAAGAQLGLERARLAHVPVPSWPWLLFLAAAALAVAATFRRPPGADVERPAFVLAELPRLFPLYFLPAASCFVAAFLLHRRPGWFERHAVPVTVWLAGLVLLFLPGLIHAVARRRPASPTSPGWSRAACLATSAALFGAALFVRTVGDLRKLPAWVENDESMTGLLGRHIFSDGLERLFGFSEFMPSITFLWTRIDQLLFGDDLFGLRLGSAVLGSLTVVLLWDFGRRLVGEFPALLGAVLLLAQHVHVNVSRIGHNPVKTPFFAALLLALFVRVLSGGGLLPLAGAAAVLGVGFLSYPPSHLLPLLLLVAGAGWILAGGVDRKAALARLLFVEAMALLVAAPMLDTIHTLRERGSLQRVESLSILEPGNREKLRNAYQAPDLPTALERHLAATATLLNAGKDDFPSYEADRAFLDPVSAALAPLAFALLLVRIASPLGWGLWVFAPAYLLGGVFLCLPPTTYHRIVTLFLFLGPALGWTAMTLFETVARGLSVSPRVGRWLAAAVVAAAALANLHYYFRGFERLRLPEHRTVFGFLACRYARTHVVVDATALDGREYVPRHNLFPELECPSLERIRVEKTAALWDVEALTSRPLAVLIVPEKVVAENPGTPTGYRIVREEIDTTIRFPEPLALHVYELEREPGDRVRGNDVRR